MLQEYCCHGCSKKRGCVVYCHAYNTQIEYRSPVSRIMWPNHTPRSLNLHKLSRSEYYFTIFAFVIFTTTAKSVL